MTTETTKPTTSDRATEILAAIWASDRTEWDAAEAIYGLRLNDSGDRSYSGDQIDRARGVVDSLMAAHRAARKSDYEAAGRALGIAYRALGATDTATGYDWYASRHPIQVRAAELRPTD